MGKPQADYFSRGESWPLGGAAALVGAAPALASVAEFFFFYTAIIFSAESETTPREQGRATAPALAASLDKRPCSFSRFLAPSNVLESGLHVTSHGGLANLAKQSLRDQAPMRLVD